MPTRRPIGLQVCTEYLYCCGPKYINRSYLGLFGGQGKEGCMHKLSWVGPFLSLCAVTSALRLRVPCRSESASRMTIGSTLEVSAPCLGLPSGRFCKHGWVLLEAYRIRGRRCAFLAPSCAWAAELLHIYNGLLGAFRSFLYTLLFQVYRHYAVMFGIRVQRNFRA